MKFIQSELGAVGKPSSKGTPNKEYSYHPKSTKKPTLYPRILPLRRFKGTGVQVTFTTELLIAVAKIFSGPPSGTKIKQINSIIQAH